MGLTRSRMHGTEIHAPTRWPTLDVGELWRYRAIVRVLTLRNLQVRYRQTLLGVAWVLLQPLAYVVVLSIVLTLLRAPRLGVPAPVFFLCALVFFLPTAKLLTEGTTSIIRNSQLVNQIYVPRGLLPLSVATSTLVDMAVLVAVFCIVLPFFDYWPNPKYVLLPLIAAIAIVTGTGLAYGLSAANTRYRDLQLLVPFLTQMWFWLSPVFFPAQVLPEGLQPIYYLLNPLALVITASRWVFVDTPPPPDYAWVFAILVSSLLLVTGYAYFKHHEPTFADDL